ncbi:hypothetical protein D3C74_335250 [compost metagenome]
MRSTDRLDPIARRSWSASAALKLATSIAICMSCSWNRGTPSVLASDFSSNGCRYVTSSRPRARLMYGCTEPPWMGPGRMSATSITMS